MNNKASLILPIIKVTKHLLGLNYERVQKNKKRICVESVALLWIRTRKLLTAHLWF